MSLYQPFFNGKVGVADLTTLSVYTLDLPREICGEHIGGATLNARLLSEYESDTLILGTGPLTGSFAPASSLLVGTFRSPRWDHLCHVPFMLRSGPEMKFSGFDVLVIRGAAMEPCALSVGRGQVRVLLLTDSAGKAVPELLQMLKHKAPGFRASSRLKGLRRSDEGETRGSSLRLALRNVKSTPVTYTQNSTQFIGI